MKKTNQTFLSKTVRYGLCFALLTAAGTSQAVAQEETEDSQESAVVYAKRKADKAQADKKYEMTEVSGCITDNATGQPMGGVRVQALGQERWSCLTNEDGTYTLKVPTFVTSLYIYAPDYLPQQLAIKGTTDQNASLLSSAFRTFYTDGTTITAKDGMSLDQSSSISIERELENHLAADVHSTSRSGLAGQGAYLSIRGVNSINANAQPLIVIDGNIIDPMYDRTSVHEGFYNNVLAGLDPENVESIEVLKNGTALYGAKGGNGVIVIKTKRGRSQATKIDVRIFGGMEFVPNKINVMNGNQYRTYLSDVASTVRDFTISSTDDVNRAFLNDNPNYYYKVFHNNTDWQKDMYRNTFTQNYKVNVEGGDDVGMYSLSLGYTSAQGTQKGTDFSRLNLRFNTDIKISNKVSTELDIAYSQLNNNILDSGWSEDYDMQNIGSTNVLGLISAPMLSPYAYFMDENNNNQLSLSKEYAGKYAANNSTTWIQNPFKFPKSLKINEALRNPYWITANGGGENKNYAEMTQININVAPKYQINKHLYVMDRFNYSLNRNNEKYFLPINGTTMYQLEDLGDISSVLKSQFGKEATINNDLRIGWGNKYGAHSINAMGGWRYNNYSYSFSYIRGYNNENDKLPNIEATMPFIHYGGTKDNWVDMTYYLQANYNYANRYFAELTVSSQSSSKFGKNTQKGFQLAGVSWGIFPSLQLGWVLSNEKWFKTGTGVNYLKLTAGFDQSGNDNIDYYAARTYWESQQVTENTVGLVLKNISNSAIQWETTTKWNVGLQGAFLNNRLTAGIDLFWHKTSDMLTIKDINYVSGMNKFWTNEGEMTNRGFEVKLNAALINTKNWKWEVGASMGHYNNRITALPSNTQIDLKTYNWNTGSYDVTGHINGYTSSVYGQSNVLTAVGEAAGSFYGWQFAGVLSTDEEASKAGSHGYLKYPTGLASDPFRNFQAGDAKFVDQNGDGVIDDNDKIVIGNPNPDIYGNLYTSLTWKNLRLDVNFKYSLGNEIYNYQRSMLEAGNTTYNQTTAMTKRWTFEGQQTDIPKVCYIDSDDYRNNERMSDRWIEDGSYLKLKNVRLTYTIPYSNSWLQGLRVWAEGNNLWTITRYLGTDPEMSARNNSLYQGVDNGLVPNGRGFNVGFSINL